MQRILAFEPTMIGSDGLPHDAFPHPRLWATFPRVLGHYSRKLGLFPLETGGAQDDRAHRADLRPRRTAACSQPGACADLTVFDADTVDEAATFEEPIAPAHGIDTVIVNGAMVWREGKSTGARPGRVLARVATR